MSQLSDEQWNISLGMFCGFVCSAIICVYVFMGYRQSWRDDAVSHGHAEYYLDENNDRQWRWKEPDDAE